jgi:hypothetical protein
MKLRYLPLLVILAVAACEQSSTQYKTISKASRTMTTLELHWVPRKDISAVCSGLGTKDGFSGIFNGCARSKPTDLTICEIYLPQPNDFDDTPAIMALGHETWHCLGAKHA